MKKIIVVLSLVALVSSTLNAQDKKNVVKANPLGLLFGSASLAYERALGEKSSIVIAPSFGGYKLGGFKYSSVGLGGEYRAYISSSKTAPEGVYLSPGIAYTSGKIKLTDNYYGTGSSSEAKFNALVIRGVIGKQWIWDNGFTIDLNGGLQYLNFNYTDNSDATFSGLKGNGILPTLGFSIGYAF